jgi:NAD(P)H-flavin reductase
VGDMLTQWNTGGLHSLASYGTVLLIAGGIGITHPLSYLREFADGFTDRSMAVRRVTLVWVVRHLGMFYRSKSKGTWSNPS